MVKPAPLGADQVLGGDFQVVEKHFIGFVAGHIGDGADLHPVADSLFQIDHKDRQALRLFLDLAQRRSAGQQDHQVRMLDTADPDLLAIDLIPVTFLDRGGLQFGGVGPGCRFGHGHGLQAQRAAGDAGQVFLLLLIRTMPQQRAHVIHLPVAMARVSAAAVHLLHDDRGFGQPQTRATVFLWDHRGKPALAGQRIDEFLGVGFVFAELAMILWRKLRAKCAQGVAQIGVSVWG